MVENIKEHIIRIMEQILLIPPWSMPRLLSSREAMGPHSDRTIKEKSERERLRMLKGGGGGRDK